MGGVVARGVRGAGHQGEVTALDVVGLEQRLQTLAGRRRFRHDEEAARILVQTVNNPRSQVSFSVARIGIVGIEAPEGQQSIDEGAGPMSPSGMNDASRRLVDDEEVGVLEDDVEPHRRIGEGVTERRRRRFDGDDRTQRELGPLVEADGRRPVPSLHATSLAPSMDFGPSGGPTLRLQPRDHESVHAYAYLVGADGKVMTFLGTHRYP